MDNYNLMINDKNVKEVFVNNILGRNEYVIGLIKWINRENGNIILSLEGDWGSGKTFLLKELELLYKDNSIINEWKNRNIDISDIILNDAKVFYYNAWENDGAENPLLNLVYNLTVYLGIITNETTIIPNTEKIIGYAWDNIKHLNPVFEVIDFIKQFVLLDNSDIFESIKKENAIVDSIKQFVNKVRDNCDGKKLVIIIDELDRCKPEFALKVIESIKHYFYGDGIIVILAINNKEMYGIIKKYYGYEVDANVYLDKIIDIHFQVPDFDVNDYIKYVSGHYTTNTIIPNAIKTVINKYKFSLRLINRYIGALNHLMTIDLITGTTSLVRNFNLDYIKAFISSYLVPYLIGIRIYDSNLYDKIIYGEAERIFVDDYFYNHNNSLVNHLYNIISSEPNLDEEKKREFEIEAIKYIYNKAFVDLSIKDPMDQLIIEQVRVAMDTCNLLNLTGGYKYK